MSNHEDNYTTSNYLQEELVHENSYILLLVFYI